MNQTHKNHSPTHQHQQLFHKNNRLYQQLLQNDYLGNQISQNKKQEQPNIAPMKFNISYQNIKKNDVSIEKPQIQHQFDSNGPKNNNLFKSFQTTNTKINYSNINKSYPDTFSIIEHQNQENSTINIYSLTRNQIAHDLSLSSNHSTAKCILEEQCQSSQPFQSAAQSKQSNFILNSSILQQSPNNNNQILSISHGDKFKKYRSQQFSYNTGSKLYDYTIQEEEQGKVPKLLAEKNMKNEIRRKISGSQNSQKDENDFKTVVNEIHIIPYKINNEIKPYAFTVPTQQQNKMPSNNRLTDSSFILPVQSSLKIINHNLNKSNSHQYDKYQQKNNVSTDKKQYILINSNPQHQKVQKINSSVVNRPISNLEPAKIQRMTPKSEPKYHQIQQKTIRSNSIENKPKPTIIGMKVALQSKQNREKKEIYQYSQITKPQKIQQKYNPEETQKQPETNVQFQQQSIIYQSYSFDVCCGFPKNQMNFCNMEQSANKINYLPTPNKQKHIISNNSNHKTNSQTQNYQYLQITSKTNQPSKEAYKINPINFIKGKTQGIQERKVKKGLRLVGYGAKKIQQ